MIRPEAEPAVILPKRMSNPMKWLIAGVSAVAVSRIPEAYGASFSVRDKVPEPFDVPDHIGNLATTIGVLAGFSSGYWRREIQVKSAEEVEQKRKVYAFAIGAVTVAANAFAEKVGYGPTSTPDYLDFAYGLIGGVIAYRISKPNIIDSEELKVFEELDTDKLSENQISVLSEIQEKVQRYKQNTGQERSIKTNPKKERQVAQNQAKSLKNKRRRKNRKRSKK